MRGCLAALVLGIGGWVVLILAVRELGWAVTGLLLVVGVVLGILRARRGAGR